LLPLPTRIAGVSALVVGYRRLHTAAAQLAKLFALMRAGLMVSLAANWND